MNDLRTTEGRRKEILENIRAGNLVSFSWITSNPLREKVAGDMMARKEITLKPIGGMMYKSTINKELK